MSAECTIQDVFIRFYPDFEKNHALSAVQRKAAYHIMNCKTGAFGVNISVCEDCGCVSIHYNSCRDRCCPMCQEFPKEKWVDARREDVLDAPYFHVVFTVPEELNPLIYSNQKFLYDALYHASSDTLRELASDSKYLGADIGYVCILHTWGSEMNFHPHIHAVVLGGGLDSKNHWKDNGEDFFLPIRVVSRLFRGKYLAELKQLWEEGRWNCKGSTMKTSLPTCWQTVNSSRITAKTARPGMYGTACWCNSEAARMVFWCCRSRTVSCRGLRMWPRSTYNDSRIRSGCGLNIRSAVN